jgi:hypothetical protein
MIKTIFSFGFTKMSRLHTSGPVAPSLELRMIKRTLLGMIGVHLLRALVPLVGTLTVNDSMKLLLLPIPT